MSAILNFDFQKREQLRFSEVNYLNYTKRLNFACGNYVFPKTRGNKNKPWTHSTPLKPTLSTFVRYLNQHFFGEMIQASWKKLSEKLKHDITILVR